jgi:hypothetical protein
MRRTLAMISFVAEDISGAGETGADILQKLVLDVGLQKRQLRSSTAADGRSAEYPAASAQMNAAHLEIALS